MYLNICSFYTADEQLLFSDFFFKTSLIYSKRMYSIHPVLTPGPVECVNCSEPTAIALLNALRENVLARPEIRPVFSLQTPTVISIDFYIYGILGVVSKSLFCSLITLAYWNIEGLSWDPTECGTKRISLPRNTIWTPDIVINEFMDENKVPATYYLYIDYQGQVEDSVPFHVVSSCNLDIYTFPFDIQNCSYTFNSYLHPMKNIFQNSLDTLGTNGEWELIGIIPEKKQTNSNYSLYEQWDGVIFHIVLRRKAAVYVVNLLLPSCFLAALDVFSFLLPAQHVDRSSFKMTLILGYTVFLLLMNDLLPVTGNNIPLINVFFSVCLALMVGSLLETILITNLLCGSAGYPRLPDWIRVLMLHYIARIVLLEKSTTKDSITEGRRRERSETESESSVSKRSEHWGDQELMQELRKISRDLSCIRQKVEEHQRTDEWVEEWIHLGLVLDRLYFILYMIFITVSFVFILIQWLTWYSNRGT
ncbi:hypothetical protein AMEX_G19558 [Astyanax mexicanus]|uniref:5-hydroxytryptamine receptor 3A-like n=1 Tax=Astyanax mexicanus TaxID=7994 RepID=A0A8T2L5L7_ASTMX|nr:hypothetical protein AMEX_G19558 [Astyanax mexicanus]